MNAAESGALWSPQQREWLQALGHPSLVLVAQQASASAQPPLPSRATDDPQAASVPPVAIAAAADGLQMALLRATGLPAAEATNALQSLGVDAAALRGDPGAKRLLWSRLRRLRGSRPA